MNIYQCQLSAFEGYGKHDSPQLELGQQSERPKLIAYIPNPNRGQRTYQVQKSVIYRRALSEATDKRLSPKQKTSLTAVAAAVPAAEYGMKASTIL
jgi:hypothetical protein